MNALMVWLRPRRAARQLEEAEANLVLLIRTIARMKEAENRPPSGPFFEGLPPRRLHLVK
jgi:hypothetical protein